MEPQAKAFLDGYLSTLSQQERDAIPHITAEHFCAEEKGADNCADLVRKGTKTATCSMKYWYETGECRMPVVGALMVVLNWAGEPLSIIRIVEVSESRFCDVEEEFARAEGEGDRTLAWWRGTHWEFFRKECEGEGFAPSEEMALIQERFELVWSGA